MKLIKNWTFLVYTPELECVNLKFPNYQKIDNILTKINLDQYIFNYFRGYLINVFRLENTCSEVIFSIELAVK